MTAVKPTGELHGDVASFGRLVLSQAIAGVEKLSGKTISIKIKDFLTTS